MKYLIAIIFFILGMITYGFIPTHYMPAETLNIVPIEKATYFDEAGYKCVIYQQDPAERAECSK